MHMKVLVVEDEGGVRRLFERLIKMGGHEVRTAEDGVEGLKAHDEFEPDLIISDICMPRMDGLTLLKRIRKDDPECIFLLMTGMGSEEVATNALRLGANDYLCKPLSIKELHLLLEQYRAVIADRTAQQDVVGRAATKAIEIQLESCISMVPKITDQLLREASDVLSRRERLGVRLALFELLVNAIEHGNLGISYDEKRQALLTGSFPELYRQRLDQPALVNRKVKIRYTYNPKTGCEWVITDEGEGFDWKNIPNPMEELGHAEALNGRGIFLAKMQFDELEYIEQGNIVRVTKACQSA
jgi:DNA-binding response OmpR family regulator